MFSKHSGDDRGNEAGRPDLDSKCTVIRMQAVEYCEQTSLHGFQYLTHRGVATKIGWLVVVILSITASVIFMTMNLKIYLQVGN